MNGRRLGEETPALDVRNPSSGAPGELVPVQPVKVQQEGEGQPPLSNPSHGLSLARAGVKR